MAHLKHTNYASVVHMGGGDNGPQPQSQMLYSHVSNEMPYDPRAYNSNAWFIQVVIRKLTLSIATE